MTSAGWAAIASWVAVVVSLAGAWLAWRQTRAAREQARAATASADAARRSAAVAEEQLRLERQDREAARHAEDAPVFTLGQTDRDLSGEVRSSIILRDGPQLDRVVIELAGDAHGLGKAHSPIAGTHQLLWERPFIGETYAVQLEMESPQGRYPFAQLVLHCHEAGDPDVARTWTVRLDVPLISRG